MAYQSVYQMDEFQPHGSYDIHGVPQPVFQTHSPQLHPYGMSSHSPSSCASKTALNPHSYPVPDTLQNPAGNKWQPGFWRGFPIAGFGAIVGATACSAAAIAILVSSNHKSIDEWGYYLTPAVYLAIASVLANVLLAFALAKGAIISFWRNALHGYTLPQLQRNWDSSSSLYGAVLGTFRAKAMVTGIACLFTTISVIRGPLNQRATSIQDNVVYPTNGTFQVGVAFELPAGYTGINLASKAQSWDTARLTSNFTKVVRGYSQHADMTLSHAGCGQECHATVKAFGFRVNCSKTTAEYSRSLLLGGQTHIFSTTASLSQIDTAQKRTTAFPAKLTLRANYSIGITGQESASVPKYTMLVHECDLYGGVSAYNVSFSNETMRLQSSSWKDDEFLETVELMSPYSAGGSTIIGGFQYAADYLFSSTADFTGTGVTSSNDLKGAMANQYIITNGSSVSRIAGFSDPMDDMINTMRELAFRASLQAAQDFPNNSNFTQLVPFYGQERRTIYVTHFAYLIAAAIISFLGILTVSCTFYGWWELGRDLSIGPLELANAFGAPLLHNVGSNVNGSQMLKQLGNDKIKYGEVTSHESMGRNHGPVLAMQRANVAIHPRAGVLY